MAWTEIAVEIALMGKRNAAEVSANRDQYLPIRVARLHPFAVRFRVGKAREIDRLRLLDFLLGAVIDENRLAAPEHLDHLTFGNRREVDLDRSTGRDGRSVRVH